MNRYALARGEIPPSLSESAHMPSKKKRKNRLQYCTMALAFTGPNKVSQGRHPRGIGYVGSSTVAFSKTGQFLNIRLAQLSSRSIRRLRKRAHDLVDEIFDVGESTFNEETEDVHIQMGPTGENLLIGGSRNSQ